MNEWMTLDELHCNPIDAMFSYCSKLIISISSVAILLAILDL